MKEHLKLDTISTPTGWMESHKNLERLNSGTSSDQLNDAAPRSTDEKAGLPSVSDDVYDASGQGIKRFDESAVDGLDFNGVLEHLNFIRQQSSQPEGRQLMSQAHGSISPKQVIRLFS
ncbi:MAG: hypothetical protein GY940_10040 [bacterium]|nr:hypothetical protein [bacterium]